MKKIDVEKFVNKVVNDNLIRVIDDGFMSDDMNKYLEKYKDVPDDYDQKQDYGIHAGDSENAKTHLLNTLSIAYQKGIDTKVFPEYEEIIQKDLRNWLNVLIYSNTMKSCRKFFVS